MKGQEEIKDQENLKLRQHKYLGLRYQGDLIVRGHENLGLRDQVDLRHEYLSLREQEHQMLMNQQNKKSTILLMKMPSISKDLNQLKDLHLRELERQIMTLFHK